MSNKDGWGCVYYVCNVESGKGYVGYDKTGEPESHRWRRHIIAANKPEPKLYFHRAIKAAGGPEKFVWRVIWRGPVEQISEKEIYYIKKKRTFVEEGGYNLTRGGDGSLGYKASEKTRERLSV